MDHTASSGNRYILNPPGTPARIHQHLDIGQGEVDFDELFRELRAGDFDGTLTACVFAWEERAKESSQRRKNAARGQGTPHMAEVIRTLSSALPATVPRELAARKAGLTG